MAFKPFKIDYSQDEPELDPVLIFDKLTLRGSVNNLWGPQIDCLKKWHELRAESDIALEMNTGGGKTLVGLLCALSLMREHRKPVVFSCPTNQLAHQVQQKANECGIETASYDSNSKWVDKDCFTTLKGPCITSHAAVFNGKSVFQNETFCATIIDDAHTAGSVLRNSFTISIDRKDKKYDLIADQFRDHFRAEMMQSTLNDVLSGSPNDLLFVPLHAQKQRAAGLTKILRADAKDDLNILFAWPYLKDKIHLCTTLISCDRIEIAPACIPVGQTPPFKKGTQRIYLTATLPSLTEYYRNFGLEPRHIKPDGRSGESQRVIIRAEGLTSREQREFCKQELGDHKVFVITKSRSDADYWKDFGEFLENSTAARMIDKFAQSKTAQKLIAAARYDGIDLPGDACRVMILDGLPTGTSLIQRYLCEILSIESIRAASIATRLVQALGRIFRSNTDHGVVFVTGNALHDWLDQPSNQAFLPKLLQQQIKLSNELVNQVCTGQMSYRDIVESVLDGDRAWDEFYTAHITKFATEADESAPEWLATSAKAEHTAHSMMWNSNYPEAGAVYAETATDIDKNDKDLGAWLHHFAGYCFEMAGNIAASRNEYQAAARHRASLSAPQLKAPALRQSGPTASPTQAAAVKEAFGNASKCVVKARSCISELTKDSSAPVFEEAFRKLGELLGLKSTRPEKTESCKLDNLWIDESRKAAYGFDVKSRKESDSTYNKQEIGNNHNHFQWMKNEFPEYKARIFIVGPLLTVSQDASPHPELRIISIESIQALASRILDFYENAITDSLGDGDIHSLLAAYNLDFPACVDRLDPVLAKSLVAD